MKTHAIAEERLHNALILVVDDVEANRVMLVRSLSARGYNNILIANDGSQALQITHEHKPDLVILDLVMPGMDGFSYCQAIRHDRAFDNMPIVVQTMLEDMNDKVKAFFLGASDYICKPIDPDELSARTQVHLMNKLLIEDLDTYRSHINAEMEAARSMQNRLMPDGASIAMCEHTFNMKIASHFETSSMLGGDCWSMRPLSYKKLAIYAYDFSGHGVSAALNVFRMHTVMQECSYASNDPGQFLSQLNKRLQPLLDANEFATMFYGVMETDANSLLYATAASPTAFIFNRNEASARNLSGRGFPLGVQPGIAYETKYTHFAAEDLLLLYSDCLIESKNPSGEWLSELELQNCVMQHLHDHHENPAANMVSAVLNLFRNHCHTPLGDDLTINAYWRAPLKLV